MTDRPIGGHAFTAGGLAKGGLSYVDKYAATAVQVFVSNPRGWALPAGSAEQDAAFREGCAERGVSVYIHACLLVNLGSPTPATVQRSVECLRHALARGRAIGARGVVFHAGSAVSEAHVPHALRQVGEALRPVLDEAADGPRLLDEATDGPRLLVEPSAGGRLCLAKRVEDLERYLDAVQGHPSLGVCFDTCHAWAAGHDLATPDRMTATLDALVGAVGAERVWLVHANDSKDACGSNRDRHENLGKGQIGAPAFASLLAHPTLAGVPVIVETPNDDSEYRSGRSGTALPAAGHGADISLLRKLAAQQREPVGQPREPVRQTGQPRRPPAVSVNGSRGKRRS